MTTSQTTWLCKPAAGEPVSTDVQTYFRARNQYRVHSLLLDEFARSGITQAELALRCRKRPEVVSRILCEPGNWTLNTLSDLIFAMRGGEPAYSIEYPLNAHERNQREPDWLRGNEPTFESALKNNSGSAVAHKLELA